MAKPIMAAFHPQAWQNDDAIDVDPEGEIEWDVTAEILAMDQLHAMALSDDDYDSDNLRNSANAPQWVRDWDGPFYIEVEDSIAEYFANP